MSDKKISQLPASTTPLAGTEVLPIVQSSTTKQVSVDNLTAGRNVAARTLALTAATGNPILSISRPSSSGINISADNDGPVFQPTIVEGIQIYNVASTTRRFLFRTDTGNLTLDSGNLVIGTAGKGIDFSADPSAAGMTSELLDDYEEGTWTATLTPLTSGTITLSANTCTYTKVGRLVTVNGQINTSAVSSPTGRLRIGTLPFVSASGTSFESVATIRVAGAVAVIAIDALLPNAGNYIDIYPAGTSTDTYASNIDASTQVIFSAKYFV